MNTSDEIESSPSRAHDDLPDIAVLAGFLEITFDAAVAFDTRERITYWNPAAERMYGWSAREALGKTPAKLFRPLNTPDEKRDRRQRQARLKRGEILRGEQAICRKDGSSLQIQYVTRAVFDAEGKLTGYLAIYRDLSVGKQAAEKTGERDPGAADRKAEEALRARTEEIETLLKVSPVAIFVAHDPECLQITGNPAGYRMVKLPDHANISKSAPDQERPTYRVFRNGAEVPAEELPMQKAARLGVEVNEEELELRFADGSRKFLFAYAKPLFDAQGRSRGAVAAMLDITDRTRIEQQLEQNHRRLNDILASIQDDFYVLDRNWYFAYASRQFTSRIGKEPEDFVGNNIWEMFPKHLGTVLEENFRAAMEKREMRRFEIPGQYTHAWYRMTVFPSADGITVLGTDISEHRRAEDALRASEERLRQMIETSLVAIGFGDSTGKIFDANESFYRLTGYSREEMQASQMGWDQLTPPEYAELDRQMIAKLTTSGSAGPYEKEYIRKDGSRVPLLLTISKLPGRDEHIALLMDISGRKRTEQALARALQELYAHIDNSPLAVVSFDAEYRISEWSAGAERMFGWRAEEVLNKRITDLHWVHEEDAPRVAGLSADMLAGRTASNVHANRNYRKDGSVIECEWYNSALLDTNGKLVSVRSQVLDVTERKRAQEMLTRQGELLQRVFENIPVLLVMWNPHLRAFTLNRHAESVLGWTTADANNGDFMSMVYPDPAYRAEVIAYMQSLVSGFRELVNVAKSGERIPIEWANVQLADHTMIGIGVDLREYKRAEEALRAHQKQLQSLNETLEQQVQEKTAEVRHLASDLIKAVQRERNRLSHILHDDLQQRIYAIRMQLTFLRDHFPDENGTAKQEVSDVESQLDEMLKVTRNLSIDLSPPILRDEGLSQAIHWLAVQMQQRYGLPIELRAEGVFAIPDEELHVLLFNCVRELLFNVVKHAQASRAVVALQWSGSDLQIEVCDDGKGFSVHRSVQPAEAERSEADHLRSSSGLPTIRYQLSLFGGRMEIQSESGAGTHITLIVPVTETG